jgi:hypothetical protein
MRDGQAFLNIISKLTQEEPSNQATVTSTLATSGETEYSDVDLSTPG